MKRVQELDIKLVQWINLHFCWKLGWSHADAHRALLTVFGADTLHPTKSRKWYAKFQNGRTSLVDLQRAPREKTGRTPDNIDAVKRVVDTDKSLTVAAISRQTGLASTSVYRILKRDLDLSLRCAKLVPNVLTPQHIVERFTHCRNMLNRLRVTPSFIKKIVTMDESWIYQYDPELKRQASQWLKKEDPRPSHPRRTLSSKKCMMVSFFDHKGMIHLEFIRGGTVDTGTFISILTRFKESLKVSRPRLTRHLHMDNAPAHGSKDTRLHLLFTGQKVVDHPALSPDLAPSDFWLFPRVKKALRGHMYPSLDALEAAVRQEVGHITAAEYRETMLVKWPMRWSRCPPKRRLFRRFNVTCALTVPSRNVRGRCFCFHLNNGVTFLPAIKQVKHLTQVLSIKTYLNMSEPQLWNKPRSLASVLKIMKIAHQ